MFTMNVVILFISRWALFKMLFTQHDLGAIDDLLHGVFCLIALKMIFDGQEISLLH